MHNGYIYSWTTNIAASTTVQAYYYIRNNSWTNYQTYREMVPSACALMFGTDRGIVVEKRDTVVNNVWARCEQYLPTSITKNQHWAITFSLSPNPCNGSFKIIGSTAFASDLTVDVYDFQGRKINGTINAISANSVEVVLPIQTKGLCQVKVSSGGIVVTQKVIAL